MSKTAKSSTSALKKAPGQLAPTREEIARRAYEIYLERGGAPGHELEDWTRAERELVEKNGHVRRRVESKSVAA